MDSIVYIHKEDVEFGGNFFRKFKLQKNYKRRAIVTFSLIEN